MKIQISVLLILVTFFLFCSSSWADNAQNDDIQTKFSLSTMYSIEPMMKSSGSSGSKSSSSSKSKDGTDDGVDDNGTSDGSSSTPWWVWLIVGAVILVVIGLVVWFLFLR
jgi:cobalamin biosynthesis Mg chelatase CobN